MTTQSKRDAQLYRDSEMSLVWHLRKMDSDTFSQLYQQELDHLDFLESTKRHKGRIEAQRRKVEVFTHVGAEG